MRFGSKKAQIETDGRPDSVSQLPKGLLRPESPVALLSTPRRQLLLQHIWQRTSLSRPQFQRLYREPIERYAALVQQFPASESHHHAYMGGMLDHGLEIVAFGLKLRQSYLLPIGAPPEMQAAQTEAWTAATAYAALLHDVGKLAVDLEVEHADGTCWRPWHGTLTRPYRFRFRADRIHRLHEAAAGLLYAQVLGPTILDWLSGFPELWAALLYVLASRHEHSGVLGELVAQADRASVAQALGGDPGKVRPDAQQSLQRKLREGLRYLVRERFKLNQPQASDGWLTPEGLWLVSKTACDKLRAHLLSNGISGVPENNSVLFDVLQDQGLVQITPESKAIWTARVLGANGWTQEFTFLKVAPNLIWDVGDRPPLFQGRVLLASHDGARNSAPAEEAIPATPSPSPEPLALTSTDVPDRSALPPAGTDRLSTNPAVDTPPPDSGFADRGTATADAFDPTPPSRSETSDLPLTGSSTHKTPHGERFLSWLRQSVRARRLIVNDAKALVHSVDGTAFIVTPKIFQRFLQEFPVIRFESRHPEQPIWMALQKSFERLGRHRRHPNGLNIWTCEVAGPRKTRRVNGYLLLDGQDIFLEVPPNNPYLHLIAAARVAEN